MRRLFNPVKALNAIKKRKITRKKAEKSLRERLRDIYGKRNREERALFTEKLKAAGISALEMMCLTEEALKNPNDFIKWEIKSSASYKPQKFSDVKNRTLFSKVLLVVKDLYATDIADDVTFIEAVKIVMHAVLIKPKI